MQRVSQEQSAAYFQSLALAVHLSQLLGMPGSFCVNRLICILQLTPANRQQTTSNKPPQQVLLCTVL